MRQTVDQVLDRHGIIPKRGYIVCPAHDDHEPSCKVSEEFVYCFTCGWNADAAGLEAKLTDRPVADVLRAWDDGTDAGPRLKKRSVRELKAEKYLDFVSYSQEEIDSVRDEIRDWVRINEDARIDFYQLALDDIESILIRIRDMRDDEDVTPFQYEKHIEGATALLAQWGRRWRRELG